LAHVPHFILEYHSFLENPPTSTFNTLSKIIQTLYAMAQFCPTKKFNSNIISGEMHMIGFRPASDRGKSAGMNSFLLLLLLFLTFINNCFLP